MKNQEMDTTNAFVCKMCGHCCHGEGGIVVSQKEQERIADFLRIPVQTFLDKHTVIRGNKHVIRTGHTGFCVFFGEKGCSVHAVKPDICLAWPYFRGNIVDKVSWEMASEYCPGINLQVGHAEFCRQALDYLQKHTLTKTGRADEAGALKVNDLL